ncbi:hypothetical protein VNI00_003483 [Paramarasmius palmivorus]|uniref:Uncharacterized protein n=1 Tax=Paramarasmius palmivorus TaxID=297713 RepID=A0AAW0DSN9_9AGAR
MANNLVVIEDSDDEDVPYGWNISKLCEAAHLLRLAPEYQAFTCDPKVYDDASPVCDLQEFRWYILIAEGSPSKVKEGIYRNQRIMSARVPTGGTHSHVQGANNLDEAREIWRQQCSIHHADHPLHQQRQKELDDMAYSQASLAKAALVHQEIVKAYPRFQSRRRRRRREIMPSERVHESASPEDSTSSPAQLGPSTSISTLTTPTVSSSHSINATPPELEGWSIYIVHSQGSRRHLNLEYAITHLVCVGESGPACLVLARTGARARAIYEIQTGRRIERPS